MNTQATLTGQVCPACPDADQIFIARSHQLTLSRCHCGRYWLHLPDDCHPAEGCEQALAEIIESLARLKLPGAVCDGRRVSP